MSVKPKADTCAACHVDVHRGTFKQDCKSCHNETSFGKAPFDHSTDEVPATGKHDAARLRDVSQDPSRRQATATGRQARRRLPRSHDDLRELPHGRASGGSSAPPASRVTQRRQFKVPSFTHTTPAPILRRSARGAHLQPVPHAAGPRVTQPVRTGVLARRQRPVPRVSRRRARPAIKDVHLGQEGAAVRDRATPSTARSSRCRRSRTYQDDVPR